jgi:glutaminyl-tRNA synthetase
MTDATSDNATLSDFIRDEVRADMASGRYGGRVCTRFPPEPNGYMHVGHVRAICTDFGIAEEFGGVCNLRFDDTNPEKEDVEYVDNIIEDIHWLGYDWGDRLYYASDYYGQLYEYAEQLILKGKAYVCDLTADEVRDYRGTLTGPGVNSPYRERSIAENLDLFRQMRDGAFPDGSRTLRAKIDMAAPNLVLRDPVLYRIRRVTHQRTGDTWCIYPMYDFAHSPSDSLEGVTHSLCSSEYIIHRPLYDWVLEELGIYQPRQIEFGRLDLTYTVTSKRKCRQLVEAGMVSDWDDPRMPTLAALRRRGYTPEAIRAFVNMVNLTRTDTLVDVSMLEFCVRQDLNTRSARVMGVLDPLKVVIVNYPEGQTEELEAVNNPEDESAGTRQVPFSRELYIEQADFREDPPRKYYRLAPGREVRLRYAYFITCVDVIKDEQGNVIELHCTYDPETRGGDAPDGRKVKATLHWVSAPHALQAEVRLYDRLFNVPDPDDGDFMQHVNPDSLEVLPRCYVEPFLATAQPGYRCQFERLGYFCVDPDSTQGKLVFNRTITLRDTWAKIEERQNQE